MYFMAEKKKKKHRCFKKQKTGIEIEATNVQTCMHKFKFTGSTPK